MKELRRMEGFEDAHIFRKDLRSKLAREQNQFAAGKLDEVSNDLIDEITGYDELLTQFDPSKAMTRAMRIMQAGDTKFMKTHFKTLNQLVMDSPAVGRMFEGKSLYLDNITGDMKTTITAPTIHDLSDPVIKGNTVRVEGKGINKQYTIGILSKKFSGLSPLEANARYWASSEKPSLFTKKIRETTVIDSDDFATLNAIINSGFLDKGKVRHVTIKTTKGTQLIEKPETLVKIMKEEKRTAINRLRAQNFYNDDEIAQLLDFKHGTPLENYTKGDIGEGIKINDVLVDDSVYSVLTNLDKGIKAESIKPKWTKVTYAQQATNDADTMISKGMLESQVRIRAEGQADLRAVQEVFGADFKHFPDSVLTGDKNHAEFVSQIDETNNFFTATQSDWGNPLGVKAEHVSDLLRDRTFKYNTEVQEAMTEAALALKVAKGTGDDLLNNQFLAEATVINNNARKESTALIKGIQELAGHIDADATIAQIVLDTIGGDFFAPMLKAGNSAKTSMIPVELMDAMNNAAYVAKQGAKVEAGEVAKLVETIQAVKAKPIADEAGAIAQQQQLQALQAEYTQAYMKYTNKVRDNLSVPSKDNILPAENIKQLRESRKVNGFMTDSVHVVDNSQVSDLLHTYNNLGNVQSKNARLLATRMGKEFGLRDHVYYPPAYNTKKYSHVAFVEFNHAASLANTNKKGVIAAHSASALEEKIAALHKSPMSKHIKEGGITDKGQVERYKKAQNEYDYEQAFTSDYVDSSLMNKGRLFDLQVETDFSLVDDMISSLVGRKSNTDRGFTSLMYADELKMSQRLENTMAISPDKVGAHGQTVSLLLNLPNPSSGKEWLAVQNTVEEGLNRAYNGFKSLFRGSQGENNYEAINKYMEQTGLPRIYSSAEDYLGLNRNATNKEVSRFVSKANAVAGTLMLRLDATQSLVNAMSTPIMLLPEMKQLRAFIDDPVALARWDDLATIKGPTGKAIPSNGKLMADAVAFFHTKAGKVKLKEYTDAGITGNMLKELHRAADELAGLDLTKFGKVSKAASWVADKGSVLTRADYSEDLVKFVAAYSAEQLVKNVKMSPANKLSILKSFVKKVHGNYNSNQRATLFRGFSGQAIGLFQTYQFNLMQRLFKHVGSDSVGAVRTMMGAQASIFGAQSIPGFQLVNDHIADRYGNRDDHANIFSTLEKEYGEDGNFAGLNFGSAADWFLYGIGSNISKPIIGEGIDLYSRGDLTPRTPILLPTSFKDIPAVSMATKSIGAVMSTVSKIAHGSPLVESVMEGLAHNGLNRPLAGIAQMGLGYRTTNRGTMINTYDSNADGYFATLAIKALGAKPLDEAIAVGQYHRALKYKADRYDRLDTIGRAMKDSIRANTLTPEVISNFMGEYTSSGGDAEDFNRWMGNQLLGATESQIGELRTKMSSPEGRYLKTVLGGNTTDF